MGIAERLNHLKPLYSWFSTADFGWFLNYNAVIFQCENYDTGVLREVNYLFKIQRDIFYNGVCPKCETLFKRQTF